MSGAFTGIASNILVPLFYARFDPSLAGVSSAVRRALIVGPSTVAAAAALTYVPSVAFAAQTWGAGSPIAAMVAAFRANEPVNEVWAIAYPDAGGATAATGTITFTGAATANGTHALYIAGNYVPVGVTAGDTATTQATNTAAAINTYLDQTSGTPLLLPVTASASTGTVTLTARAKGTIGNQITINYAFRGASGGEYAPAGTTVAVSPMASGATDPTLTGLSTLMGANAFEWVITPWGTSTNLAPFTTLMLDNGGRWDPTVQLWGHVFSAARDTSTNLLTLGSALNDPHLSVLGVEPGTASPAYIWAAAWAGRCVSRTRDEPGRPVQSLAINGVLPAPAAGRFNFTEKNSLLAGGIALAGAGNDNTARMIRGVTTYKTNAYGQTDPSMRDLETMYQSMAIVGRLRSVITTEYPDYRLADDGTQVGPGIALVTPRILRNRLIAEYEVMETFGWVENTDAFADGLIVQRNTDDPSRVDVLLDPYYTSGLRIFAMVNQFRLRPAA